VFGLQEEIAREVSRRLLGAAEGPRPRGSGSRTGEARTYDAYLEAKDWVQRLYAAGRTRGGSDPRRLAGAGLAPGQLLARHRHRQVPRPGGGASGGSTVVGAEPGDSRGTSCLRRCSIRCATHPCFGRRSSGSGNGTRRPTAPRARARGPG